MSSTPVQLPHEDEKPFIQPAPRVFDLGDRDFDNIDPREMGIDYLSDEEYQYGKFTAPLPSLIFNFIKHIFKGSSYIAGIKPMISCLLVQMT